MIINKLGDIQGLPQEVEDLKDLPLDEAVHQLERRLGGQDLADTARIKLRAVYNRAYSAQLYNEAYRSVAPYVPDGCELIGVDRLYDTFPWFTKVVAWFLWRTPVKFLLRKWFQDPFSSLVMAVQRKGSQEVERHSVERGRDNDDEVESSTAE